MGRPRVVLPTVPARGRDRARLAAMRAFATWLVDQYPGNRRLVFRLVPHAAVESVDGRGGFAVYVPRKDTIYQATGDRRLRLADHLHVLAHEYRHYLQRCAGRPYSHRGVSAWAWGRVRAYAADGAGRRVTISRPSAGGVLR